MSVEITLYTKTATKSKLIKFLKSLGFQKARHFIDAMNTDDYLSFMWFAEEDYESAAGVEATVIKLSVEEMHKHACTEWILHTRTRSSGSYEDKKKQNEVIRQARADFGGSFYNDWYGTNRYTNLSHYTKLTPLEKGLSLTASLSIEKLGQIQHCLMGYRNELTEEFAKAPDFLRSLLVTKDPSILLYNSLIPFLVSIIEYFFSQCFVHFIKYDKSTEASLIDEKLKIGISDVLAILRKGNSLEQVVTQSYNFQNLESINKAYKKYLNMDVYAILSKRKKANTKVYRILTVIQQILRARHLFVHELSIDYALTKQDYLDYSVSVEHGIKLMMGAFKARGLNVEIDPLA